MRACPSCNTQVADDLKFCTQCGTDLNASGWSSAPSGRKPTPQPTEVLGAARKWLLAIAILTLLASVFIHFVQSAETEKQIAEATAALAAIDPVERDTYMKQETGMSFQEAIDHDRGMVRLLTVVNVVLAILYFGLWIWARREPYLAALVALLLFVSVVVVSAVLEPGSLHQGILIKVLFTVALVKAVQAGHQERRQRLGAA